MDSEHCKSLSLTWHLILGAATQAQIAYKNILRHCFARYMSIQASRHEYLEF